MAERSDHTRRVDEIFARAVQEQLEEHRELRSVMSRVDEALESVRSGLAELGDRIAVREDSDLEVSRRLQALEDAVVNGMRERDDRQDAGAAVLEVSGEALARQLAEFGAQLVAAAEEAAPRITRAADQVRSQLLASAEADRVGAQQARQSLQAVVETVTATAATHSHLLAETLRQAHDLVIEAADEHRSATQAAVDSLVTQLDAAVAELRAGVVATADGASDDLTESVSETTAELAGLSETVRAAVGDAEARLGAVADHLGAEADVLSAQLRADIRAVVEGLQEESRAAAEVLRTETQMSTSRLLVETEVAADRVVEAERAAGDRLAALLDRLDALVAHLEALRRDQSSRLEEDAAALAELRDDTRADIEALLADLGARGEATVEGMAATAQRVLDGLAGGVDAPPRRRTDPALECGYCGFVAKTPAGLSAHRRGHA